MKYFNVRNITAAFVAICALSITACNTVEGVGQDAQSVGRQVEDAGN